MIKYINIRVDPSDDHFVRTVPFGVSATVWDAGRN